MTWRRGFFRLWLVLTGFWVLVVGGATFFAALNPSVYVPDSAYLFGLTTFPPEYIDTYGQKYRDALGAASTGLYHRIKSEVEGVTSVEMFFPANTSKEDMQFASDYQVDRLAAEVRQRREATRWTNIQIGAVTLIVPPLVVLVLGVVVGWVLSGFVPAKR